MERGEGGGGAVGKQERGGGRGETGEGIPAVLVLAYVHYHGLNT